MSLINDILVEWAYRVDDGMPNPKNPIHIKELGIVLTEMGLDTIKDELIENITEEDTQFTNPILNKKIKYKSTDGKEKEGLVGNLLRLQKDHPGRKAAEAMLPPEDSEERKQINKDLGTQAQPQTEPKPKGDETAPEGEAKPAEPQPHLMFDPKTDPAMGARLDAEKRTLDKIAKGSKEDDETTSAPKTDNKEAIKGQNTDIAKSLKGRKDDEGNTLDAEVTDGGSILIGVQHGKGNASNQAAIQAIETLPTDTKVMFVGEGGSEKDKKGRIRFHGEQNEFRNAVMNHFDDANESSWDENANVNDENSPVFDDVANALGGSKSKAKAAIWSNMVSQGDELNADDYLDDEGKQWLIDQAKKGGADEIDKFTDFNKLSDRQKEDLYQLNYRDDDGYGETEISKAQQAYNDFRQKELDRKIKEAEENGYTVIAPMGNSHVDLWRERNKGGEADDEFKPVEPTDITKEMPKADVAAFSGQSDIDKITPQEQKEISMKIDELNKLTQDAIAKGEKAPNYNLCQVTVPGTNLYCDNNLGIPREDMPQFKGKPQPGTPAAEMPVDKNGEVDTEPIFKKMLADKGIKVLDTEIPSDQLKATQSELVGSKVAGMAKALEKDPNHSAITAPIYVSRDGYVVDGHHRWAAVTSNAIKNGEPANMKVHVIDMDAKDIIPMANKFAEEQGVAAKKADANQEGPKSDIANVPKVKDERGVTATTDSGKKIYSVGGGYYSDTPNGKPKYIRTETVARRAFLEGDEKAFLLIFEARFTADVEGGKEGTFIEIPEKDKKDLESGPTSLDSLLSGIEDNAITTKAKEAVKQGAQAINDQLNKLANDPKNPHAESHKKVQALMNKMFGGEKLSEEEKNFLHPFIRIAEPTAKKPDTAKYYIAKEPGNFKGNKRVKVEVGGKGGNTPTYAAFRQFTEKGGLSQMSASTFGTKLTTANQTFVDEGGKTKLIQGEGGRPLASVEKDEAGNVTAVNIGGTKITRLDANEPNITPEEKKVRERNNRNMDEYAKAIEKGDLQFIDMDEGVSPDSPENRVTVIKGALSGMAERLRNLAKKEGVTDERVTGLIDAMDEFAQRDPNDNPQQWFKDLNALMSSIANDEGEPSLKECWANYAEVYSAIVEMHDGGRGTQNGSCALLPESTTLETVDVITINTNGAGERKIVTLDGKSVKKGVGGASALTSKTEKSTYKDDPDGTKKEAIVELSKSHDDIYRMKLDDDMNAHIELQTTYRTNLKNKARSLGVSDEFIAGVEANLKEPNGAWKSVNAAYAAIKEQRTKKGKDISDETMKKIRMRLESYYMYSQISHEAYNTNVDVQDFSNDSILSQAGDRGGAQLVKDKDIKIDSSNGVTILAYIKPEFNVGTWGDEGRSGNAGAGRFHNEPKR